MSTTVHVNYDHLPPTPERREQTEIREWMTEHLRKMPNPFDQLLWLAGARAMLAKCREMDRAE